jgi:hypothetical protein
MPAQIDINAFAAYALDTFDCDERFEDDEFAVTFDGSRIYVERRRNWFNVHVGLEVIKLPRH